MRKQLKNQFQRIFKRGKVKARVFKIEPIQFDWDSYFAGKELI